MESIWRESFAISTREWDGTVGNFSGSKIRSITTHPIKGVRDSTGYLPVSGEVPYSYEILREQYWPRDPSVVLVTKAHEYWNNSYSDLGAKSVLAFCIETNNIKFIKEYKNFDDSRPDLYAFTVYADNNENKQIDRWAHPLLNYGEWFPLNVTFNLNPGYDHRDFFGKIYKHLAQEAYFSSEVKNGKINFSGKVGTTTYSHNDLFVTVDSGRGQAPQFPDHPGTLTDIFKHIPMTVWWKGTPSATNHATICSEEAGEYLIDNLLKKLR